MAELTLIQRTLEVINLAKSKGYVSYQDISPVMFESWMLGEKAFCNTACAIIAMWLRDNEKEHMRMLVFVDKMQSGRYRAHVSYFGLLWRMPEDMCSDSYELEWIAGLTHALEALPPGA